MITSLQPNEIFVFGSNLAGHHAGGAAKQAAEQFGAEDGVGRGMTGQTYAFPTLDKHLQQLSGHQLLEERDSFYETARARPDKTFLMTPVGTGIAGFSHGYMRTVFTDVAVPVNVVLPFEWVGQEGAS